MPAWVDDGGAPLTYDSGPPFFKHLPVGYAADCKNFLLGCLNGSVMSALLTGPPVSKIKRVTAALCGSAAKR
jgi:hypothetical protein